MGKLVVVVALAVGADIGAVVVGAGVAANVTSSSYTLPLPLDCCLDLPFSLYVLSYSG